MEFLNLDLLPHYLDCSYRTFLPGEFHVDRQAEYDVLLLCLKGTLIFFEDGQRRAVHPGEWYIQRTGRRQEGREESLIPHYFYIHFTGGFVSEGEQVLPLSGVFLPDLLLPVMERLDLAAKNRRPLVECSRWFYELLSLLQNAERESGCSAVSQVQAYIAAHYEEPLSVKDLAKRFSYSPDHIIRLFKRQLGVTPHQYIVRLRLSQARQMLLTTNRTLATIAAQTGFSDSTTLFRAFQKEMGCAPSVWRELRRRKQ